MCDGVFDGGGATSATAPPPAARAQLVAVAGGDVGGPFLPDLGIVDGRGRFDLAPVELGVEDN